MVPQNAGCSPPSERGTSIQDIDNLAAVDPTINIGTQRQAQENLLLEAIKALSAEEICADTLETVTISLAKSGWRSTATLLMHAAGCADAGDFLNAERNRQRARLQFIEANDAFRQFMEARAADGDLIVAEAFL